MTNEMIKAIEEVVVIGNDYEVDKISKKVMVCFERLYKSVDSLKLNYLKIGEYLNQFEEHEYYKSFGYKSMADFCQNNLQMDKGSISRCINVYKMVSQSETGKEEIDEKYMNYSYSQLVELVALPEEERETVTPDMSVAEIREYKRKVKNKDKGMIPGVAQAVVEGSAENISCDIATSENGPETMTLNEPEVDNSLFAYIQSLDLDMLACVIRLINAYCLKESERINYIKIKGLLKKDASVYFEIVRQNERESA